MTSQSRLLLDPHLATLILAPRLAPEPLSVASEENRLWFLVLALVLCLKSYGRTRDACARFHGIRLLYVGGLNASPMVTGQ